MYSYKAPLRDIDFIRYDVLDFDAHYRAMGISDFLNRDAEKTIVEQAAKFAGYVVYAYMWLRIAVVAQQKIGAGEDADGYYDAKVETVRFYFERLLPRTATLRETMLASTESLMALRVEQF